MKIIEQLLKGVLLWGTLLSILCFIGGLESLIEADEWLVAALWFLSNLILGYICYKHISYREFYKLSGNRWLNAILR